MVIEARDLLHSPEKINPKHTLIIGGSGYIGTALARGLAENGDPVTSTSSSDLDITNRDEVFRAIAEFPGKCVILAAAKTNVGKIETDEEAYKEAVAVNVEGARNVAEACVANGKNTILIGTGYERAGSQNYQGPYSEDDPLADEAKEGPLLGKYAKTKLDGQRAVEEVFKGSKSKLAVIFIDYPCGEVVGVSDKNQRDWYLKTLLVNHKLGRKAFADQQITITDISDLVKVVKVIKENSLAGNFNVAASGLTTPYELLEYMLKSFGEDTTNLEKGSLDDYRKIQEGKGAKCVYPSWGGLKTNETTAIMQQYDGMDFQFKTWQELVDSYVSGEHGLKEFWIKLKAQSS